MHVSPVFYRLRGFVNEYFLSCKTFFDTKYFIFLFLHFLFWDSLGIFCFSLAFSFYSETNPDLFYSLLFHSICRSNFFHAFVIFSETIPIFFVEIFNLTKCHIGVIYVCDLSLPYTSYIATGLSKKSIFNVFLPIIYCVD